MSYYTPEEGAQIRGGYLLVSTAIEMLDSELSQQFTKTANQVIASCEDGEIEAKSRILHSVNLGFRKKREIGAGSDVFHRMGFVPLHEEIYRIAQFSVRKNFLYEQSFLGRLFKRVGPLSDPTIERFLSAVEDARQNWSVRLDEEDARLAGAPREA